MKSENKKISLLLICGPIAAICYIMHDFLGNLNYPGYDVLTQAVSDLTAESAPSKWIAGPLSGLYGVFSVILVVFLCFYINDKIGKLQMKGIYVYAAMNIISAIGYTLFPLTDAGSPSGFPNTMHIVVTVLVVLTSIASLLLIAVGGRKGDKVIAIGAGIAFVMMLFGAIGSNALPASIFGITERFSTYAAVLFTAFLGIRFMGGRR